MEKAELKGVDGRLVIWRDKENGESGTWVHALCCKNPANFCKMTCPLLSITDYYKNNLDINTKFKVYTLSCGGKEVLYEAYPGPKELAMEAIQKLN